MLFSSSTLISLLFSLHMLGAGGQSTSWSFPTIRQIFSNASFPVRPCNKRDNQAPVDKSLCGPKPKTCLFGDQVCPLNGGTPYPVESCTCNGTRQERGTWVCEPESCPDCLDATTIIADWTDNTDFGCGQYESFNLCNATDCPFCEIYISNGLTADQACCVCGGGELSPSGSCATVRVTLDIPIVWTDSVGSNCSWYDEDPQTRCIENANEFNTMFNLTVGEACCACKDIEVPAVPTCTDLQDWTTALNRSATIAISQDSPGQVQTCSELTRADCQVNSENFGFTAGEACCKCGGGSKNPNSPTDFDPTTLTTPFTAGQCSSDSSRFNMCIKASPNFSPAYLPLLDAANDRWSSVIVADSPEFTFNIDVVTSDAGFQNVNRNYPNFTAFYTDICGFNPDFPSNTTDDLHVCVSNRRLGPNIFAQAAPIFGDRFVRFGSLDINADLTRSSVTKTGDT